jgi:hypothetical protein
MQPQEIGNRHRLGPEWAIIGSAGAFRFFAAMLLSHWNPATRRNLGEGGGGANRRRRGMRLLWVAMAAALLTVPAVPAYSQMGSQAISKPMQGAAPEKKKDDKTPQQKKAEEKAFNDAVTRIPDQKFDPWGKVR